MNTDNIFTPKHHKMVLVSKDFRSFLATRETTLIEQRIIFVILSALKGDQSLFIAPKGDASFTKSPITFEEYLEAWPNQEAVDFTATFKHFKSDIMLKNISIKNAINKMADSEWLRLEDDLTSTFKSFPYIIEPRYNLKNISFKIHKTVLKYLMNMSPYISVKQELPFKASSKNTLKFLLWLSPFKKRGFAIREYSQLLRELNISKSKYEGRSRFERDFIKSVQNDLDSYSDISFNYSCNNDIFKFTIQKNKFLVGETEKHKIAEDIRRERSMKYLKTARDLSQDEFSAINSLYIVRGYEEMAEIIKRKIDINLKGSSFLKEVYARL
ncbi:replication initiation protein [Epilithonimonas sp. JDS]|uniref:replication initiation protein n=1 Tax=Epilithonimonas sp. JDS TaxID=2902797 RepID=UPI001E627573|nr:replication initiation protein [Epilithonimonas sp. JDS]MCD9854529.1 replication initiation protein [Epilithonimonas sp. JDS]